MSVMDPIGNAMRNCDFVALAPLGERVDRIRRGNQPGRDGEGVCSREIDSFTAPTDTPA